MKKIKIVLIILLLIPLAAWGVHTGYTLLGHGNNDDAGGTNNDTWSFGGNYATINEVSTVGIGGVASTLSGTINSELFGNFDFSNLEMIKTSDTTCISETTYSLSGTVSSVYWGDMSFQNGSYICPNSGAWSGSLYSALIGIKSISNVGSVLTFTAGTDYTMTTDSSGDITITVTNPDDSISTVTFDTGGVIGAGTNTTVDSDGTNITSDYNITAVTINPDGTFTLTTLNGEIIIDFTISTSALVDQEKVFVKGVIGSESTINTGGDSQASKVVYISTDKAKLTASINKNIEILTKNKTPISGTQISDLTTLQDLYYFNYEGDPETSASNENNEGKILKIENGVYSSLDFSSYQVGVTGQKTVIVKGGNVYINADIYNANSNSILVIIVKRDKTSANSKNGGNIYINPNVTNIDAVLIADGSIISYNGTSVVTATNSLRNQLYIYGSTYTQNSIGSTLVPYGSDGYIKNGKGSTSDLYDLTKLRYFNLTVSDSSWADCSDGTSLIPRYNGANAKTYAWAGKRECYNQSGNIDPLTSPLRGSDLLNPLIIEYNPYININPPFVLRSN